MSQRIAVCIEGYQYNTSGTSLYDAVSNSMDVFASDWWRGPKWTAATVFDVREIYGEHRQWTVRAGDVIHMAEAATCPGNDYQAAASIARLIPPSPMPADPVQRLLLLVAIR